MKASAKIEAIRRGGSTVFPTLRSDPPLLLRRTPDALLLVAGAAGPLTGDQLHLSVDVGPGAQLTVGSVAASLAQAGPGDPSGIKQSVMRIEVTLGAGATLDWNPEPLISATGSNHCQLVTVRMHETASLRWRDAVIFGRTDEHPGALDSTLRVERAGRPVVHQQLSCPTIDSWLDPSMLGGARALVNDLRVGPRASRVQQTSEPGRVEPFRGRTEVLAMADDITMIVALADDFRLAEAMAGEATAADQLFREQAHLPSFPGQPLAVAGIGDGDQGRGPF
ncbi:MAG: urease accessory protein UreD [Acidimicrobiales bacterium]